MKLDVAKRQLGTRVLTFQQFGLVVYLALRRGSSGGGNGGWVRLDEIVRMAPGWSNKTLAVAGRVISNLAVNQPWFDGAIEHAEITKGPYRFRDPEPEFRPSRDAADEFVAILPPLPKRSGAKGTTRRRRIDPTELAAYDLLAQYGVYLPEVVDLMIQRVGDPAKLASPGERIQGYRVRATLDKNRGNTASARKFCEAGLKLARKLNRGDDVAFLLDQLGGTYQIEGRYAEAKATFNEEITFLRAWGTKAAEFHLVGAYRGLAAVLYKQGELAAALTAIRESTRFGRLSGNEEGLGLAALAEAGLGADEELVAAGVRMLENLPAHHVIGRVMALGEGAAKLFRRGARKEAERLLARALADAKRLGIGHEITKIREIGRLMR
jgi:tetratricopeptide (TPR) repeat protein